jgi:hypothetical protein
MVICGYNQSIAKNCLYRWVPARAEADTPVIGVFLFLGNVNQKTILLAALENLYHSRLLFEGSL